MKIYRVETENCRGPWRWANFSLLGDNYFTYDSHPTPAADGLDIPVFNTAKYIFGCKSLKLLSSWFVASKIVECSENFGLTMPSEENLKFAESQDLEIFNEYKFFISVYEVPDNHCKEGNSKRQHMFNMKYANKIGKIPIETLFRYYSKLSQYN